MKISELWLAARDELSAGRRAYICFVVAQSKGSPGTTAARMLVTESGERFGTIGGGIMERRVLDKANGLLVLGAPVAPQLKELKHKADGSDAASGLICGGGQVNVEMVLLPGPSTDLVAQICEAALAEKGSILMSPGGLLLLADDAPCDVEEGFSSKDDGAWKVRLSLCNQRRVVVFGGGHCGVALANTMHRLDYASSLVEPREDVDTLDALNPRVALITQSFEESSAEVRHHEETIAIVMTYSMDTDIEALSGVLKYNYRSIGVMGSSVKIAHIRRALSSNGFSDLQISQIVAPIGLNFNSDTPEEIAVSVAAQILLERKSEK